MGSNTLHGLKITSPKLPQSSQSRWYRYYAGYATEFVDDVIGNVLPSNHSLNILDPWMGSGTTVSVAARRNLRATGFDLNPAMLVVAKGRLIAHDTEPSVSALTTQLLRAWAPHAIDKDPLSQWLDRRSTALVRGASVAIEDLLVGHRVSRAGALDEMSSLAAFFFVGLFEALGRCLREYGSRNPTWLKRSELGAGKVSILKSDFQRLFRLSVRRLDQHVADQGVIDIANRNLATMQLGDSRSLPLEDGTIDAVLSSPPYVTRLDYVVGHLPELAILGFGPADAKKLRDRMIGTPTVGSIQSTGNIGAPARAMLRKVASHDSYAAKSYYEPNFRRYFEGMSDSLSEIHRVLRPKGEVVLVVQDSWFKGLRIDLAQCLTGTAKELGFDRVGFRDFTNVRSMVQINPRADKLARASRPVESVLHLRRSE